MQNKKPPSDFFFFTYAAFVASHQAPRIDHRRVYSHCPDKKKKSTN